MKRYFSIAGITMALISEDEGHELVLDPALEAFYCDPVQAPDIIFESDTTSPFPSIASSTRLFTSLPEGLWSIYENNKERQYYITLQNIERNRVPFKIIRANRTFRNFIVYERPDNQGRIMPLQYPFEELAITGHINLNRLGILLHSAGISWQGRGLLFAGTSGSGKSTISEIWQEDGEAVVLTDERVVIRSLKAHLWAFGTPWHGTADVHRNTGSPIVKIFFIKHGKENRARPISTMDALNRLLVRCFPTFWNRNGMEFVMEFCENVANDIPCYELEFVKDPSIIDYVKEII